MYNIENVVNAILNSSKVRKLAEKIMEAVIENASNFRMITMIGIKEKDVEAIDFAKCLLPPEIELTEIPCVTESEEKKYNLSGCAKIIRAEVMIDNLFVEQIMRGGIPRIMY